MLFPDASSAAANGGYYCPTTLPKPGSKVRVEDGPYRKATVLQSQGAAVGGLQSSLQSGCTFTVQYPDGTTDVLSAATEPENPWPTLALYAGYMALKLSSTETSIDAEHEERLATLEEEFGRDEAPDSATWSAEYWGSSDESDGSDQAVRTTLEFGADGSLSGHGHDHVDGTYRVTDGRWALVDGEVQLAWREAYDQGFSAMCAGVYKADTGRIEASFTSDRGVRGDFSLAKKPSIF